MKTIPKRIKIIIIIALLGLLTATGSAAYYLSSRQSNTSVSATQVASTINTDDGDVDIDWASLPSTTVTLTNQPYAITAGGTYIISGTTTSGVTVKTDENVKIVLANANISSSTGAGIYIEQADNTLIYLQDNTTNMVSDASTRTDETIDGAIYSADDLIISGNGTLNVNALFADAIVSKDDLKITSGTINVSSVDDGIRGKDSVYITGGSITVKATGDGIKATNDADVEKGYVYITGGNITVTSGDDAIKGEQKVNIDGGTIKISSSVEGIEAALITINKGIVSVNSSDDGINGSASTLITNPIVTIDGGTIDVTVAEGDTDAIDSNGDVYINGGTIAITSSMSSIDYDGTAELSRSMEK